MDIDAPSLTVSVIATAIAARALWETRRSRQAAEASTKSAEDAAREARERLAAERARTSGADPRITIAWL